MELLHTFFKASPMAALFVSLAIGYWIGKIKMGNFQLGGMAGTLLVAIVIGQVGVMGGKNRKDEHRTRQRRASIYPLLVWRTCLPPADRTFNIER